jgi:hypothetical protein
MSIGFIAEATANSVPWTAITGVTWTGTPPSTPFGVEYNLTRVGNLVTVNLALAYDTAGSANTEVIIPWQAGWPAISKPSWATGALAVYGGGYHGVVASGDVAPTTLVASQFILRRNAANDGDEYRISFSSLARSGFYGSFSYQAA